MFLSVRLPELIWQAECVADPELRGRPLVIGSNGPGGSVAAASPEARRCGVAYGQPIDQALALCPDARVDPGRLDWLVDVSAAIQTHARTVVSALTWENVAYGVAATPGRTASEVQADADRLRQDLAQLFGVSAACGIARHRLAADVASRLVSPAGSLHVLPGYERRMLAPVSVRWVDGVDDTMLSRLASEGITTVGDLATRSRDQVVRLVGGVGLVLARLATGDELRPTPVPKPSIRHTSMLRFNTADVSDHERPAVRREERRRVVHRFLDRLLPELPARSGIDIRLRVPDAADRHGRVLPITASARAGWRSASEIEAAVCETLDSVAQEAALKGCATSCQHSAAWAFVTVLVSPSPSARSHASRTVTIAPATRRSATGRT
jgi:nucleotidyltransferase/DNA polymerase involved in DNA repair